MISLLTTQCQLLKKQKVDFNIMSIDLIRKNTSSPFHLQRSIVPQGEDGAYQRGGFNPDAVYNNDAANEAVESFSKTMGEAISNMDFKRKKKEDAKTPVETKKSPKNQGEKVFDIEKQTMSNYSDYSEQAIAPEKLRKQQAKERKQEEQKRLKDELSNFSF
jgi:hypothetical protein